MTGKVALYSAVDEDLTHYEVDVESASLARRKTVKTPAHIQYAWPHPSRQYLYVATSNRAPGLKADFNHVSAFRIDPASETVDYQGRKVFGGGENSIVSFSLDAATGEPTLLQHADSHCRHHVRTFAMDPGGRVMVAASIKPMTVQEGTKVLTVPAALSVFRVAGDGKLEFARKYDVDTGADRTQYWMGIIGLD